MAHRQQQEFLLSVKEKFPDKFKNVRVLDIGSLDINGNNRYLFENSKYLGIDIGEGNNVDVVIRGHEFKDNAGFDVIVSSECFEHDEYWPQTIQNAIELLRPKGLFLFTCATQGRPEHGTKRTSPQDSPFTSILQNDYYQNLDEIDIRIAIHLDRYFSKAEFEIGHETHDLYFWGIKF